MTIEFLRMIFNELSVALVVCFDFLTLLSIVLLPVHIFVETICNVFHLHTSESTLIGVVFSVFFSLFALSSQPVNLFRNKVLCFNYPFPLMPLLTALSIFWAFIMIIRLLRFLIVRYRFSKRVAKLQCIAYDEAYETACRIIGIAHIKCKMVTGVHGIGVFGVFRPFIVLPEDFMSRYKAEERVLIYLHELSHLKRIDSSIYQILEILKLLFYFHIPVKWQLQKLELGIEQLCDKSVMRLYPNQLLYSELLIHQIKYADKVTLSFAGFDYHAVKQRIEALFPYKQTPKRLLSFLLILLITCSALLCLKNPEKDYQFKNVLVVENVNHELDVIPVSNANEASKMLKNRYTKYIQAQFIDACWEGMFGIYTHGKQLPK